MFGIKHLAPDERPLFGPEFLCSGTIVQPIVQPFFLSGF